MNRKYTAWKKSRKFGDIYGGREHLKLRDNIFARAHSLKAPELDDELPILIQENPSRDFFFPLTREEALDVLKSLPKSDYEGITHLWLRRAKKKEFTKGTLPLAEFVCGSGVRAIILYPWRRDLVQEFGERKPSSRVISEYQKYLDEKPNKIDGQWQLKWNEEALRRFYIDIIYHEVGHHIDQYFRRWSKANNKQLEEFADQYAFQKASTARYVFNRLQKNIDTD
jgi:hypothetical protein